MNLIQTASNDFAIDLIHVSFYALHMMDQNVGLPGEDGKIVMPPPLNLTSEKLERGGFYLLDDGMNFYFWIGSQSPPALVQAIFDKASYELLPVGKVTIPALDNPFSKRINSIMAKMKEGRVRQPYCYLVKEDGDPVLKLTFLSMLIEDKSDTQPSYPQFLIQLRDKVNSSS